MARDPKNSVIILDAFRRNGGSMTTEELKSLGIISWGCYFNRMRACGLSFKTTKRTCHSATYVLLTPIDQVDFERAEKRGYIKPENRCSRCGRKASYVADLCRGCWDKKETTLRGRSAVVGRQCLHARQLQSLVGNKFVTEANKYITQNL